jgi:phage terminase small subunit
VPSAHAKFAHLIYFFMEKAVKTNKKLSNEAKKVFRTITKEWTLDASGLILLNTALEAFDRLKAAQALIEEEGIIITTPTGHKRPHPGLRIEKEARQGLLQAWKMLNLDLEPPGSVGRPGGSHVG